MFNDAALIDEAKNGNAGYDRMKQPNVTNTTSTG
jgi:hypothetical protein